MEGQQHDRMQDQAIIQAAFDLAVLARERGVSIDDLCRQIIERDRALNGARSNIRA